jgi:hypothetical protein
MSKPETPESVSEALREVLERALDLVVWRTLWHSPNRPLFRFVELGLARKVSSFHWVLRRNVSAANLNEPEHPALQDYLREAQ